jgi:hypothetical protein
MDSKGAGGSFFDFSNADGELLEDGEGLEGLEEEEEEDLYEEQYHDDFSDGDQQQYRFDQEAAHPHPHLEQPHHFPPHSGAVRESGAGVSGGKEYAAGSEDDEEYDDHELEQGMDSILQDEEEHREHHPTRPGHSSAHALPSSSSSSSSSPWLQNAMQASIWGSSPSKGHYFGETRGHPHEHSSAASAGHAATSHVPLPSHPSAGPPPSPSPSPHPAAGAAASSHGQYSATSHPPAPHHMPQQQPHYPFPPAPHQQHQPQPQHQHHPLQQQQQQRMPPPPGPMVDLPPGFTPPPGFVMWPVYPPSQFPAPHAMGHPQQYPSTAPMPYPPQQQQQQQQQQAPRHPPPHAAAPPPSLPVVRRQGVFNLADLEGGASAAKDADATSPSEEHSPPSSETQLPNEVEGVSSSTIPPFKSKYLTKEELSAAFPYDFTLALASLVFPGGRKKLEKEKERKKTDERTHIPTRGKKFLYFGPDKHYMNGDDIDLVLRTQLFQMVAAGGNPYTEDFYYQRYKTMESAKAGDGSSPSHLIDNHSPMYTYYPPIPKKKDEGPDPFEGALGKISTNSSRAPRIVVQIEQLPTETPSPYKTISQKADGTRTGFFRNRGMSVAIEDALVLVILIEDVTACLANQHAEGDQFEQRMNKKEDLLRSLVRQLQLDRVSEKSQAKPFLDDPKYCFPSDKFVMDLLALPKGQYLMERCLPSLPQYYSSAFALAVIRNLILFLDSCASRDLLLSQIYEVIGSFSVLQCIESFKSLLFDLKGKDNLSTSITSPLRRLAEVHPFGSSNIVEVLLKRAETLKSEPSSRSQAQLNEFEHLYSSLSGIVQAHTSQ